MDIINLNLDGTLPKKTPHIRVCFEAVSVVDTIPRVLYQREIHR